MIVESKNKEQTIKVVFGLMIFAFSLALAYFIASYLRSNHYFDYWGALMIAGGLFITIGVFVSSIIPVSLGFLFSADILVLHVLMANFGDFADGIKVLFVGLILAILYLLAWSEFSKPEFEPKTREATPKPGVVPQPPVSLVADDVFQVEDPPPANELNKLIEQIDLTGTSKVTFYPLSQPAFSTSEPSIIRIALYTKQVFSKSEFKPGELAEYYKLFVSTYIPTLPQEKVKVVLSKMSEFVSVGGRFEVV
ncbi:MAG: hypothetical protein Q8P77_01945 [Candidatus Veblenbacteria bacterium]|nr:hypothetical protein [Candidatus Veblenbacteria bacterium]